MVKGRYVRKRNGQRVWQEWAPQACPAGHARRIAPAWGACPACQGMGRIWRCGDCDRVVVDPEHRCGTTGAGR